MSDANKYSYTYSAKTQKEVKKIRSKYAPEEDSFTSLKKLDRGATKKGKIISLVLGISATLLLGTGMSLVMVFSEKHFVLGVAVGIAGVLGMCFAYPVYKKITEKERKRIAPEIIRLTDELMKNY